MSERKTINILSLLNIDFGTNLTFSINNDECIRFISSCNKVFDVQDITQGEFWHKLSNQNADAVLLPLSSTDLQILKNSHIEDSNIFDIHRPWQYFESAVIAVLTGDDIHDAVLAAQMDFDGILTEPFDGFNIQSIIKTAIDRKEQKCKLNKRYERLQRVIKAINQNRHILQSKVDLLCNDLVQNNRDIAGKMKEMSQAYDFQRSLTGEFDLKYMLHKALQHISNNHPDTNSAVYICETEKIEVMISDSWFDGEVSPQQIENCLKNSIIPATLAKNDTVIINNIECESEFPQQCMKNLDGLSICGIPIRHSIHNEGILVLYRSNAKPFTREELESLAPIVTPMSRSIEALLNLQDMLEMVV